MKKIKNWIIKQDFIDLIKKISYIEVPLFILFIVMVSIFIESIFVTVLISVFGGLFFSLFYVIPIRIHQNNKKK